MTRGVSLALVCALFSVPAAGQVLESGHDEEFAELLGSNPPCPFRGASIEPDEIVARYDCGELRISHRSNAQHRRNDRAEGESSWLLAGSFFVEGPRRLRNFVAPRLVHRDALWATPSPQHSEVGILDRASPYIAGVLFALMMLGFRVPSRRPPRERWALWVAMALVAVAALSGPYGSVHEHHTFLARIDCAAAADCFGDRPGWYAPIYALYAPLVRALPPTLAAGAALSLGLTLLALWSMFEWVLAATDKPFAAGSAALLVALHPAIPRLAASLTFWPMALLLLFTALRLSLPCSGDADDDFKGETWRVRVASVAAWGLTWCSSAAFTTLLPLGVAATCSSKKMRPRMLVLLGVVAAIAVAHAAPFVGNARLVDMGAAFAQQALFDPSIVPIGLALACCAGLFVALKEPKTRVWLLLLAPAFVLGFPLSVGYPTVFLHAFPLLFIYGAFAALALSTPTSESWRGLFLVATLLSYASAGESRSFADYDPPIARELHWLYQTVPALPAHSRLVLGPILHEPMRGFELEGDPIEVRFPLRLLQSHHSVQVLRYNEWLRNGAPLEGTLVYIGLGEQLFHPRERADTNARRRPEAEALLQRFTWAHVAATTIDTPCDRRVIACAQASETQVRFLRPTGRVLGDAGTRTHLTHTRRRYAAGPHRLAPSPHLEVCPSSLPEHRR